MGEPVASKSAPAELIGRGRRRASRAVLVVAAAAAILTVAVVFARSSFFSVRHVSVQGAEHLSAAKVIRESGVQGRNAIWLDAAAVERSLERDPWIATASVTRSLPSSVSIRIVERVPVAVLQSPGVGYSLVAADGTVLGSPSKPGRLPVIQAGAIPNQAQGTFSGSTSVLAALSGDVRDRVAVISQDASGDVAIRMRSGTTVRFGPSTQIQAKADALSAVLAYADEHKVRVASIDVRFPAAPSARLGDGSSITPSN
jgi:cell division protein FtsQ